MPTKGKYGKIELLKEDIKFIEDNFYSMTNQQLADALGLKLTRFRQLAYALGFKRMTLEYWTPQQIAFLKANYKILGDTELAEIFEVKWHKNKGWHKKHIEKKRRYLKLKRTPEQLRAIKTRNVKMGRFSECAKKMWETRGVASIGDKRVWFREDFTPFVVIKTKTGFVHYNRWLYEKHNGPIPPKMNVCLKEGADPINYSEKDLHLLINAQLSAQNSRKRTPPQFKQTKKLIKQIEKTILKNQ